MNRVKEFFNEHFGTVRTVTINNITYFVGIDIAKSLGYSNATKAISSHCKRPIKVEIDVSSQNGKAHKSRNSQEMLCITKSDIYRLIVKSKLESADKFEFWIFDEILPTIEHTGAYVENEHKMVDYYFSSLSEGTKSTIVNELIDKNKKLQKFYDDLMNTEGLMSMNIVSKELNGIGLKTLYAYLRGKKIMFYKDGVNIPYQRFMTQGLFKVKETTCPDGIIRSVTYATKKGLDYIRKQIQQDNDEVIAL